MRKAATILAFLSITSFGVAKEKKIEFPYKVQFSDRLPPEIIGSIEEHASLYTLAQRPPHSMAALRFRVKKDLPKIKEILFAFGYYDATIDVEFSKRHDEIIVVLFTIALHDRYTLESFRIISAKQDEKMDPTHLISPRRVGIQIGEGMDAYKVLNAEKLLLRRLGHIGYPFPKIDKTSIQVDSKKKTVDITVYATPGPFAYFGPTKIEGLKKVHPKYANYLLQWKTGKPFDQYLVDQTRDQFFDTTLFSFVSIDIPEKLDDKKELPITIQVKESLFRSVNVGVNYATLDGYGISLGWEHRNLRGLGQKFSLQADISEKTQLITAVYKYPNIKKKAEFVTYRAATGKHDYVSYKADTISLRRREDRTLTNELKRSWSLAVEYLRSKTNYARGRYLLGSGSLSFRFNTTKDRINPKLGDIVDFGVEPFIDLTDSSIRFFKTHASYAFFFPLSPKKKAVFAFRSYFASLFGLPLDEIPPPKRLYAGTEEFLRGYAYLSVSPLNAQGDPIGGRSMMMYNAELRLQTSDKAGFILFYDFGQVFKEEIIRFDQGVLNSVGVGLRYFTLAGPISLDFAFPLNPRKEFENSLLKIYVSIGQTF